MAATARSGSVRARAKARPHVARTRARRDGANDEALRSIADFLGAFMLQADATTLAITFITKGVQDLTGHAVSEWVGEMDAWSRLIDVEDRDAVTECFRAVAADGHDRQVECRVEATDGRTVWLRHSVRRIGDDAGANELWAVATDITADKIAEAEARTGRQRYQALVARARDLKKQTMEDALTGLPNRALFDDRLGSALRSAQRSGNPVGVLMLDLDRFKEINDTKGHHAGDVVLKHVALRLRIAMRAQDTAARLGGDEFACVLPNTDTEGTVRAAQRIVESFEDPLEFNGETLPVGVSIGIAMFPENGENARSLLEHADAAMYDAKANGGGYSLAWTADDAARRAGSRARRRRERRRSALSRRAMQVLIGVAAVLMLVAGAMVPVAKSADAKDSAARLDEAVVDLAHVPNDEVEGIVSNVEEALVDISWKDVSADEVTSTLGRLQTLFAGLSPYVSPTLSGRVERLIATIEKARTVGDLTVRSTGAATPSRLRATTLLTPVPVPSATVDVEIPPLPSAP